MLLIFQFLVFFDKIGFSELWASCSKLFDSNDCILSSFKDSEL